jgi:Ser/Thr protein kinase RdoA (MazF antagonist)
MEIDALARLVARDFEFEAAVTAVETHGRGLVNETFLLRLDHGHHAILQRINSQVFPQPLQILANHRVLLEFARTQDTPDLRLPALYLARDGRDHVVDPEGGVWRALEYIPDTHSLAALADRHQAQAVGAALGRFHRLLHELPVARLHTTLPGFHVTPGYLQHFDEVLQDSVTIPSIALRDALVFVDEHRALAPVLVQAEQRGVIALRVTHGDPKLDNFLFDRAARRVVALIDLDTVQPGLVQVDLADCLRSCCNRAGESPTELPAVRFDLDTARSILSGYLAEAREFLGSGDYETLFDAIRLIPFELGLRFLTDHFAGNRYFKVTQPGQNLLRARAQFRLTEDIERHAGQLHALIDTLADCG